MKNTIKKIIKAIKFGLMGFGALIIILLMWVGTSENTESEKAMAKTEEVKPVEVKPATVKPEPVEIKNNDQEQKEQEVLAILKDSYKGTGEVTFNADTKSFKIRPTEAAFTLEIAQVINGGNAEDYNYLVDTFKDASKSLQGTLGSGYTINLLNPANPDNVLLIVMDGVILYNFK